MAGFTLALVALAPLWSAADDTADMVARAEQAASLAGEAETRGWAAAGRAEARAAQARDSARQARELEADGVSTFVIENDRYVGQADDGEPHGLGVWYFDDGTRYEGEFVDGVFHGLGVLFLPGDDIYNNRYEGEFVSSVPQGYGVWQWRDAETGRDGDREAGVWVDGELDGAFTYIYLEGDFAGTVVAGELEAESLTGRGVLDYSGATLHAGSRYEGELSGHYANGDGLWRYGDGSTTYGRWHQDEALEGESVTIGADGEIKESGEALTVANGADLTTEQIRQAQELLNALGYQTEPGNGVLSQPTVDAVARFQSDHGLAVTSSVSAALIDQLRVALAARGRFASPPPDHLEIASWGTGFVVSDAGYLLTNHHVVEDCDVMRVRDLGWADVIAFDDDTDLALLALEGGYVPGSVSFRSWPPVDMGEDVVVFGFPEPELLSASGNAATGVVSALEGGAGFDFHQYQFTAPIQGGNSGGPLLDGTGNVIGVVVASYGGMQAANFAVKGEVTIFSWSRTDFSRTWSPARRRNPARPRMSSPRRSVTHSSWNAGSRRGHPLPTWTSLRKVTDRSISGSTISIKSTLATGTSTANATIRDSLAMAWRTRSTPQWPAAMRTTARNIFCPMRATAVTPLQTALSGYATDSVQSHRRLSASRVHHTWELERQSDLPGLGSTRHLIRQGTMRVARRMTPRRRLT